MKQAAREVAEPAREESRLAKEEFLDWGGDIF